eukprot:scaffold73558_cov42-Phaeocystis_antarctica.AAC.1
MHRVVVVVRSAAARHIRMHVLHAHAHVHVPVHVRHARRGGGRPPAFVPRACCPVAVPLLP